eukprot:scaffold346_cov387-Prasinococcus_capsulatus_cf.AAC.9
MTARETDAFSSAGGLLLSYRRHRDGIMMTVSCSPVLRSGTIYASKDTQPEVDPARPVILRWARSCRSSKARCMVCNSAWRMLLLHTVQHMLGTPYSRSSLSREPHVHMHQSPICACQPSQA